MIPVDEAGAILEFMKTVGVSRLTHFTSARNLGPILEDGFIRNKEEMMRDHGAYYAETDPERFDGHPDKISCSIEYPNGYYLDKARAKAAFTNYPDWACLLIDPDVAAAEGVLFSRVNAAQGGGAFCVPGLDGVFGCYAKTVTGRYRTTHRAPLHRPCSPTDVQAEVLVPGGIPLSKVQAIAMAGEDLVTEQRARLRRTGQDPDTVEWIVAEGLFVSSAITAAVRNGRDILETRYAPRPGRTDL